MNFINRNWEVIFLLASAAVVVLNLIGIIMNIIGIITIIGINVINIYCTFFSILTFSAELRYFKAFRPIVFMYIKFFAFLVFYKSRGMFYIFFGLLLLGDGVLNTIGGSIAIGLGAVMIIVSTFITLPEYDDVAKINEEYNSMVDRYSTEMKFPEGTMAESSQTVARPTALDMGGSKVWNPPRFEETPNESKISATREGSTNRHVDAVPTSHFAPNLKWEDSGVNTRSDSEESPALYDNIPLVTTSAFQKAMQSGEEDQ